MYSITLGPKAEKFLKKCIKDAYIQIRNKIRGLEKEPYPAGIERVQGLKGKTAFRVRSGEYRILYVIYHEKRKILVFKIKKRPRAYSKG